MSGERRRARRLEAGDPNGGGGPGRGRSGPNGGEGTSTEAGRTLTVNEPHGLDVGGRAPEFGASLVRSDGTVAEVTLSECLGDGPVLLTFCALDAVPRGGVRSTTSGGSRATRTYRSSASVGPTPEPTVDL